MPRVNNPKAIPEADGSNRDPVPPGTYLCRVQKVEEKETKAGDEMWSLWLQIEQGEHQGKMIFDNITFSEAGLPRVKLVCSRLGIDMNVEGHIDLSTDMLEGKVADVTVEIDDYQDKHGNTRTKNVVEFAGYERVEDPNNALPF